MRPFIASMLPVLLALTAAPAAAAAAGSFTLVNATGADILSLSIRRFGTDQWRTLAGAARAGARQPVSFADPDCAFDIRATLAGGASATWAGINLCEVKAVVLNRNAASGATWAGYE